jgi:hypothetical protein
LLHLRGFAAALFEGLPTADLFFHRAHDRIFHSNGGEYGGTRIFDQACGDCYLAYGRTDPAGLSNDLRRKEGMGQTAEKSASRGKRKLKRWSEEKKMRLGREPHWFEKRGYGLAMENVVVKICITFGGR